MTPVVKRKKVHIDRAEGARLAHMLKIERQLNAEGYVRIAGLDEAGRGPLAGPVCAAVVVFEPGVRIARVNDSKQVSSEIREELYETILTKALDVGVGFADAEEIDSINILNATKLAAERALNQLKVTPDYLLADALTLKCPLPQRSIVKGDSKSFSIAAASIVAKVSRDRLMRKYAEQYPEYAFDQHKGYGTQQHLQIIETHGICSLHRRTFFDPGFLGKAPLQSVFYRNALSQIPEASADSLQNVLAAIREMHNFLPRSELVELGNHLNARLKEPSVGRARENLPAIERR